MLGRSINRAFPRLVVALIVATITTFASIHLFLLWDEPSVSSSSSMQLFSAGTIEGDSIEKADTAEPAPSPIIIQITLDRSARALRYLEDAGLGRAEAEDWARQFDAVAKTRILRAGHSLVLYEDPETGDLRGLRYDLDSDISIRERGLGEGVILASRELIHYHIQRVSVAFKVTRSFRTAAERHDLPEPIVYTLENAFSDTHPLDELPSGSVVKLIYQEKVSRDGSYRLITGVEAAQVEDGSRTMSAFAFRDQGGRPHLFNAQGVELGQMQSLRFPVHFRYISSRFSYHRLNPILHIYRPHLGVDLAASYGTPVHAIADGRVETAGWCGQLGRCVRLKHAGGMISLYGHLSHITRGIRPGARVWMGEVIGRVGSSGLSTGPHLHFGIEKAGHFVNPLTQHLGVNHKVSPRMRWLFDRFKDRYLAMLAKLPNLGGHFSVQGVSAPALRTASGKHHARLASRRVSHHHRYWHAVHAAYER
jgi:murein DD-endopeptidase MepM/ murein hydrolase activator NlpD